MIQVVVGDNLIAAQFERGGVSLEVGKEITLTHRTDALHAFDLDTERSVIGPAS